MTHTSSYPLAPPWLLGCALCAAVLAQPVEVQLRSTTRLVEVGVVVKDEHGQPVRGLTGRDFEIYDNGKRQEVRLFRVEEYRTPTAPIAPAADPVRYTERANLRQFTNHTPAAEETGNPVSVVLIDAGNTYDPNRMTWADLLYAREQLVKFLRQIQPEDRLGIYMMGPQGFWILHEYTQDCADIVARLAAWKSADPNSAQPQDVWGEFARHIAGADDATLTGIRRAQFFHLPVPDQQPLRVVNMVAQHLAEAPGRKNLILISGNDWFLAAEPDKRALVLRSVIQANVAIYAIDPAGLAPYELDASFVIPSKISMMAKGSVDRENMRFVGSASDYKRQTMLRIQAGLRAMSEDTGGRDFVNINDIMGAIRSSFDDSRVSYLLGFYPKEARDNGSFHALKVKVVGQGRVTVRHRLGYFDNEQPASSEPKRREMDLRQAVWSPVEASAIKLIAQGAPAKADDANALFLRIYMAGVSLRQEGDQWSGQLDILLVQRGYSGEEFDFTRETLELKVTSENYQKLRQNGFLRHLEFNANDRTVTLRVIVRDAASGNLGTVTVPIDATRSY